MANNISEGEERMIALLEKIAESNGNDDSDRLAQTANGLSTAAMTVSIVALVIALLQALLQYASSNENHREKCNVGAIGRAAMLPGGSTWSWRHWRRKYTYPVLDLTASSVLKCLPGGKSDLVKLGKVFKDATTWSFTQPLIEDDSNQQRRAFVWREWRGSKEKIRPWMVCYWPWVLHGLDENGRASDRVIHSELPLLQWLRWYWFSMFQTRNETLHPRATWAQLLEVFNIIKLDPLVQRRMDAENIASSVDVPTQKVSLQELGVLAFHLGMRTVDINVIDRTILATGPRGSISTEDLPGFGKVIRFQSHGDFHLGFRSPKLRRNQSAQLFGQLCFGSSDKDDVAKHLWVRRFISPRKWEHRYLSSGRTPLSFTDEWNDLGLPSTFDNSEAEVWERLKSLQSWRGEHERYGIVWPTIILAATAACVPGQTLGFPARLMLRPFHECLRQWAEQVRDSCSLHMEPAQRRNLKIFESIKVEELQLRDLCTVDFDGSATADNVCELSSWAFWQISAETLKGVELQLCRERYISPGYSDVLNGFDEYFQQHYATSGNSQETYRILPEIISLLAEYEPDSWSTGILGDRHAGPGPKQPQNVLWTQVVLLDLTIRQMLNSCPPGPDSFPKYLTNSQKDDRPRLWRINATRAVVRSWSDPNSEWPLQNLESFLVKAFNIDETDIENRDCMTKLSNLIQLRALCFLAYLMVIPDSSSLYLASKQEQVVLPMI